MTAIRDIWGKVRAGLSKAVRAPRVAVGRVAKVTEAPRARISSLRQKAGEHPALAVGIVGGVLIGIAWIAWAIYVTTSNGVNAGLGVLITWPVLIGALALIAAPFVLTAMLVQRHRTASEPAMAGAPPIAQEPAEEAEEAENKASKKDEPKAEAKTEDDSEDEASDDEDESEESEAPAARSA